MAETQRFELWEDCSSYALHAYAFDHSATFPTKRNYITFFINLIKLKSPLWLRRDLYLLICKKFVIAITTVTDLILTAEADLPEQALMFRTG